jgi:hypothetical protein
MDEYDGYRAEWLKKDNLDVDNDNILSEVRKKKKLIDGDNYENAEGNGRNKNGLTSDEINFINSLNYSNLKEFGKKSKSRSSLLKNSKELTYPYNLFPSSPILTSFIMDKLLPFREKLARRIIIRSYRRFHVNKMNKNTNFLIKYSPGVRSRDSIKLMKLYNSSALILQHAVRMYLARIKLKNLRIIKKFSENRFLKWLQRKSIFYSYYTPQSENSAFKHLNLLKAKKIVGLYYYVFLIFQSFTN